MALDQTPGVVQTPTRDQVRDQFLRAYQCRVPAADTGPGTQPYVDASCAADMAAPLYNDAVTIGRGTNLSTSAGAWLQQIGANQGPFPRPAVGASGFIPIVTASGGSTIQAGTEVDSKPAGLRFQVTVTATYTTATPVPVIGIDTGPSTNLAVGTAMQFPSPPPGLGQNAVVTADSDGNGLTGGRPADDAASLRQLTSDARANPPASGNDAEYQQRIRQTPSLSIQQVFTYPAILGPGTIAYVFTLNPSAPGGSRAPNDAQIAATLDYVTGIEPADDGIMGCTIVEETLRVCLRVTWRKGASTWTDATQWPVYLTGDAVRVNNTPTPSLTSFGLVTNTATTDPQVGQTIGFYDTTSQSFKRIRIGAVTVVSTGLSWVITPDRTFGASDPIFVPSFLAVASPWSDSLNNVPAAVISYMASLGPGEQVASLPDPGLRQRRSPDPGLSWPSVVDNGLLAPLFSVSSVQSPVILEPVVPYATPVGVAGVLSYLFVLSDLGIYP